MQGTMIKIGRADIAEAIAEGAVKAENEALKEAIDMLLCEIAQKDELIELYRWKEQQEHEKMLQKYRDEQKTRVPVWQRIAMVFGLI